MSGLVPILVQILTGLVPVLVQMLPGLVNCMIEEWRERARLSRTAAAASCKVDEYFDIYILYIQNI